MATIDCGIDNVGRDDNDLAINGNECRLVVLRSADCIPGAAPADGMTAAIETNGGPMPIDVTGSGGPDLVPADAAALQLGASPAAIRAAVCAAYPPAVDWDWASAWGDRA